MSYIIVSTEDVNQVNPKIEGEYVIFNNFQGRDNLKLFIKYRLFNNSKLVLDIPTNDLIYTFNTLTYFNINFTWTP